MYQELYLYTNDSIDQKNVSLPIANSPYIAYFKLLQVVIPLAFTSTDSSNNTIVFTRSGSTKTASINPGNYDSETFPAALQAAMNNVSTVKDYVVTWDDVSSTITVSAGSPFTIESFQTGTTMYSQLGMTKYQTAQTGTSITGGVADITATAPLFLVSSTLLSKNIKMVGNEQVNVLAMIDTNAPQNSTVTWVNNGSWIQHGASVSNFNFSLLNARTMKKIQLSQPYYLSLAILTSDDDYDQITY